MNILTKGRLFCCLYILLGIGIGYTVSAFTQQYYTLHDNPWNEKALQSFRDLQIIGTILRIYNNENDNTEWKNNRKINAKVLREILNTVYDANGIPESILGSGCDSEKPFFDVYEGTDIYCDDVEGQVVLIAPRHEYWDSLGHIYFLTTDLSSVYSLRSRQVGLSSGLSLAGMPVEPMLKEWQCTIVSDFNDIYPTLQGRLDKQ